MLDRQPLIAIVDDEEPVRVALRRLCDACGLETRAFGSALALFESLDDRRPDCVILDAQMPGFGGLDAQMWLREHDIHIPAIFITGRDDEEMRAQSLAVGACAYLCKPVDVDVLLGAITAAIATEPLDRGRRGQVIA